MEFTYNASAIAAGGIIERGRVTSVIPSLASVALAPTGGAGQTVVSNYVSEELSFSHGETRVYGRKGADGLFTTSTYVWIKGLKVFDKLSIEELSGTVTSTRSALDQEEEDFELVASYQNVVIAGKEVVPKIDISVKSMRRYEHLGQLLGAPASARAPKLPDGLIASSDKKGLAERFNARTPEVLVERLKEKKAVQGSLIEKMEGKVTTSRHHKIFIPDFGIVRFGELMIKPGRRRVNLLRITFGNNREMLGLENEDPQFLANAALNERLVTAGAGGSMTVASVEGNGTIIGP
jgi:hypothetical protein